MIRLTLSIALIVTSFCLYGQTGYTEKGIASYYSQSLHGRKTASGEKFNFNDYTAAHKKLPFNSLVKVTHLETSQSVIVRINDRGPYSKERIIDLSGAAAKDLGILTSGIARVKLEVIEKNSQIPEPVSEEKELVTAQALKKLSPGQVYNLHGAIIEPSDFVIQVNAYIEPENVIKEYNILQSRNFTEIYTEVVKLKQKKIYRVLLGGYASKTSAQKDLRKLEKIGIKGIIIIK